MQLCVFFSASLHELTLTPNLVRPIVSEKNPDMSSMIKMEEINKLWQVNKNTFIVRNR